MCSESYASQSWERNSLREALTGIKPNFKRCLPVGFGDFCKVLERDPYNTFKPRTVTALELLPSEKGPLKLTSLTTGKTFTRELFKIMYDTPFELVAIVESMQEKGLHGIDDILGPVDDENRLMQAASHGGVSDNTLVKSANTGSHRRITGPSSDQAPRTYISTDDKSTTKNSFRSDRVLVNLRDPYPSLVAELNPSIDTNWITISEALSVYPKV